MTAPEPAADAPVRLSVNLHPTVAAELRRWSAFHGCNATEGVRRAIAYWAFIEAERAMGHTLAVIEGDKVREIVFL